MHRELQQIELLSSLYGGCIGEASTRKVLKHEIGYYISDGGPFPSPFNSSVCSVHKYIFVEWINYVWLEKMGSCEKPILALLLKTMPLNKCITCFVYASPSISISADAIECNGREFKFFNENERKVDAKNGHAFVWLRLTMLVVSFLLLLLALHNLNPYNTTKHNQTQHSTTTFVWIETQRIRRNCVFIALFLSNQRQLTFTFVNVK